MIFFFVLFCFVSNPGLEVAWDFDSLCSFLVKLA